MAKKKLEVEVTYKYTLEVDEDNSIVKEYKGEEDMVEALVGFRFSTLPVIGKGVVIKDVETVDWDITES